MVALNDEIVTIMTWVQARFSDHFFGIFSRFHQNVVLGAHLQTPFFYVLQVVGNKGKIVIQLKNKSYFL